MGVWRVRSTATVWAAGNESTFLDKSRTEFIGFTCAGSTARHRTADDYTDIWTTRGHASRRQNGDGPTFGSRAGAARDVSSAIECERTKKSAARDGERDF